MTEIIVFLVAFAIGFSVRKSRSVAIENQGEAAVRRLLTQKFIGNSYHLLNNITLPFGDGTTQIDHILVSKNGVFVIESKHYSGWIIADFSSPTWTQIKFKQKYNFQNPLHQNYKHIKVVQQLLDFVPSEHIHSIIVFTGDAEFKTVKPKGVMEIGGLVQHIRKFNNDVITENSLQFCVGRLECYRKLISGQTDVEHIAYLNKKFGNALPKK